MSMACPYPPCNAPTMKHCDAPRLTRSQRSRLIKSARKVTKILGENPMPQLGLNISPISFPRGKSPGINAVALCTPILSITKKFARAALEPLQMVYRRDSDTDNESTRSDKSKPAVVETCHGGNWSPFLVFQTESGYDSETESHASFASSQFPSPAASESTFRKRRSSLFSTSTYASRSVLSLPSSPEWDRWKEKRGARRRRKCLAKLARHLGESIPPELVFPKSRATKPKRGPSRRRRLRSIHALSVPQPPDVPSLPVAVESPSTEKASPLSGSPPPSLFDVPPPAVQKTVEVFGSADHTTVSTDAAPPPGPPGESELDRRRSRSHSESSESMPLPSDLALPQSQADGYFDANGHVETVSSSVEVEDGQGSDEPETRSLIVSTPPPRSESRRAFLRSRSATASSPEPSVVLHRSERRQGWSGEWNVANMGIVISKLRDLR